MPVQNCLYIRDVVARIDDDRLMALLVPKNRAVALQHADGQNLVYQVGSLAETIVALGGGEKLGKAIALVAYPLLRAVFALMRTRLVAQ